MEKTKKVSHPKAEEEFIRTVTEAMSRYHSLTLSRKVRAAIRKRKYCYPPQA